MSMRVFGVLALLVLAACGGGGAAPSSGSAAPSVGVGGYVSSGAGFVRMR